MVSRARIVLRWSCVEELIPMAFLLVYHRTEECRYLIKKVQLLRSRRR